jgi:prepilin-type N-terminal cleavage/methylation domain-containing protein/prepilin-type processing-associated H-X9-DG protein
VSPKISLHRGFSLVELLVVIAIIGVLIALIIPAVQRVRASAYRVECTNNLHQIGIAFHEYHKTFGSLPPGVSYAGGLDRYPFMSWNTRLLPYLEQQALWDQAVRAFAENPRFQANPPHTDRSIPMPIYSCPSDSRVSSAFQLRPDSSVGLTSYLGVEGINKTTLDGCLFLDSQIRFAAIRDGTSNTLLVGERPPSADGMMGWWYAGQGQSDDGSLDLVLGVRELNQGSWGRTCPGGPYEFRPGDVKNNCDAFHFWSMHAGGANFLFADGSVHFITYESDSIMPGLATRSGGEPVALPD